MGPKQLVLCDRPEKMKKFITRAYTDGTDFIGSDIFRAAGIKAGRNGFGDMICEVSNLIAQAKEAEILHAGRGAGSYCQNMGFVDFIKLVDLTERKYKWIHDSKQYNKLLTVSKNNEELCKHSGRELLHCYPENPYVSLDASKFIEQDLGISEYVTYQGNPFSKKCGYDRPHMQEAYSNKIKERGIPAVDVGGLEKAGLPAIAGIIKNAVAHVGIDSGMTHFALCVRDKKDVDIVVPSDRISGVSYRWINQGYNVNLI